MITALHTLVYAEDADTARAFFRDVLRWPAVDTGGGWLIFRTGPSELGVHPTAGPTEPPRGDGPGDSPRHASGVESVAADEAGVEAVAADVPGVEAVAANAAASQRFDVSLVCDDLAATMADLGSRGATFAGQVERQSWGDTVQLVVPGAGTMTLYQPRYDPPALLPEPTPDGAW